MILFIVVKRFVLRKAADNSVILSVLSSRKNLFFEELFCLSFSNQSHKRRALGEILIFFCIKKGSEILVAPFESSTHLAELDFHPLFNFDPQEVL